MMVRFLAGAKVRGTTPVSSWNGAGDSGSGVSSAGRMFSGSRPGFGAGRDVPRVPRLRRSSAPSVPSRRVLLGSDGTSTRDPRSPAPGQAGSPAPGQAGSPAPGRPVMAAVPLLLLLMLGCPASAGRQQDSPPCWMVHRDVVCRDLSLRRAPEDLPPGIQTLDLSQNQLQNLTEETLAFQKDLQRLNLHANKINFIQPGIFEDMVNLKVLDLSRNRLDVLGLSRTHVGRLTAVESLDLSGNGLFTEMSRFLLADSPSLVNLSLSGNSITRISPETFSGSSALRRISLHNNVILDIQDGAFDSLGHLTELDLSKNSITCIVDFNLRHLKILNLSRNSIELFQSSRTFDSYDLVSLDLSQNKMFYFPLLPVNNVIEHLDVSRNRLQSVNISEAQGNKQNVLLHLLHLDMSYNQLRSVRQSFFRCMESLELLNVSNNCIGRFAVSNKDLLQKVRTVDLSYNSLQGLSFQENALPSLERLFVQGNDLTRLDHRTFRGLPSIELLQLQQNNVEICTPDTEQNLGEAPGCVSFSSISNLRFLYLSDNNLGFLPAHAFKNTPLELLDLSLNPGLDMDPDSLSGLEASLVHLLLKENNISSLTTDLSSLKSLRYVDLSTNQLTSLPQWNKESSIESLNLQNNNLVTLESRTILALEGSLKTLYMASNPLSCCGNLGFLHLVQNSAVVVPDIETVTCVRDRHSEPVSMEKVTQEMCRERRRHSYAMVAVVTLSCLALASVLLVRCCRWRTRKHLRSFSA